MALAVDLRPAFEKVLAQTPLIWELIEGQLPIYLCSFELEEGLKPASEGDVEVMLTCHVLTAATDSMRRL